MGKGAIFVDAGDLGWSLDEVLLKDMYYAIG